MAIRRRAKAETERGRGGFNKMDMSKAKRKSEEISKRSQSEYHEHAQGPNYYFILPPWSEEGEAWKEVERHDRYVCPKAYGRDCLVCKELKKRAKRGDTDFVDKFKLKTQGFFNAIRKSDIKSKDPDAVKALRCSPTVFEEIINFINDEEVDITDPYAAHVVCIRRKGTGMATRYKTRVSSEPIDISRYLTDEVIEGMFDLDSIRAVQPASDKDLRALIRGGADADDDDFGGDDLEDGEDLEEDEDDPEDELSGDEDEDVEDGIFADTGDDEDEEDEFDLGDPEEEEEEEPEPPKKATTKRRESKAAPEKKTATRRRQR